MDYKMTGASNVFNALTSKMATLFPTYYRIANPYDISANPETLLKKAWGIAIGSGQNTERYVGCFATWQRQFTIGLIKQVVNTENDATGKATVEKSLLEDCQTLIIDVEGDPSLAGIAIKSVVEGDSGIQYVDGKQSNFLAIEVSLLVEYQEPI
jgi:hypothetical protein